MGIGINNPGARLDVTKPGGDTPTVNLRGSINISHFNYGFAEHTYIRGGKAGSHVFLNDLGSGNVGINTSIPIERLDVNGNINFSGVLKVNGNAGTPGHVLTSNGANNPEWKSPNRFIYDNTLMKTQSSNIVITNAMGATEIPNLTHTFTISQNTKMVINYSLSANPPGCAFCGKSAVHTDLVLNALVLSRLNDDLHNGFASTISGSFVHVLSPGTYTIRIRANVFGPDVQFSNSGAIGGKMVLQLIPE